MESDRNSNFGANSESESGDENKILQDWIRKRISTVFTENKNKQLRLKDDAQTSIIVSGAVHSNAEYCRRYRQRLKDATETKNTAQTSITVSGAVHSNAEYCRRYRQRLKDAAQTSTTVNRVVHSNAEYCRRYRQRLKDATRTKDDAQRSTTENRNSDAQNLKDELQGQQLQPLNKFNEIPLDQQVINSPPTYSTYYRDYKPHEEFNKKFTNNAFGYPCSVCNRLWFKEDLKKAQGNHDEILKQIITNYESSANISICSSCKTALDKGKIPIMSTYNGFKYPEHPSHLQKLDIVSERLISPRIPFMQIRRLRHVHGQYGIYGQIINVPVSVNTMVHRLPRNIDDVHCVYVHIKRRKIHRSSYVQGLVNKSTVKAWLEYLVNTELYVRYNIAIDESFFTVQKTESIDIDELAESIPIEESLVAQQQTLLWNDDKYLRIALGETNLPISLLFDEHAEELSFPAIYLGKFRTYRENVRVTPFMQATSELRRADRRGVTPNHILYMAMKIMRLRVRDSLQIAFKHVGNNTTVTREQILSDSYVNNFVETNLAFLKCITNSTWYWADRERDLFAIIRQKGRPTAFMTLSSNEIGWTDLLKLLYKLRHTVHDVPHEVITQLNYIEKSTLINEDSVTCAIYFNKLVNVVMAILMSKKSSPFRKYRVVDYFKRMEFNGGSLHAHILLWLENAPEDVFDRNYDKAIHLIDDLISVSTSEASGSIKLQTHKHTFMCYKKIDANRAQKCRFEAPFMPCRLTTILTPMQRENENFRKYKTHYNIIRANLENNDYNDIDDFYEQNNISSDEHYCDILRAGITRPRVFPKRLPSEKWHNPFNPFVLSVLRSNMDFQIITDEYSCAACVVEYVNKTNRSISDLQRSIIQVMDEHPEFDIAEITRKLSVDMLNSIEMSSQEAAWYMLREPMSKSSVVIVYIPTVLPIERQRIRKTMQELNEMDDDCTDVWKENWFDKYEKRPQDLSNVTLAQFVSKYYKNNNGTYALRQEPRIIRYRNYDMGTDYNGYRREMVTLHVPFRNEEQDILAEYKYIQTYEENTDVILQRRKEFESNLDIEKTLQICRELCRENDDSDDESDC